MRLIKGLVSTVLEGGSSWTGHGMESRVSAERVNGLSIVVKRTSGTMHVPAVPVEAGGGMLVASAGAELTSLTRAMREAKTVLVCMEFKFLCSCKEGFEIV